MPMPLAPQIYNPGSRGQNARYDIRGLQRGERGYTDGVYWYDDSGLSLDRPDSFVQGLKPADAMDGDQWGDYLGSRHPRFQQPQPPASPTPTAAPPPGGYDLSGDVVEMPPRDPNRIPDAQNPRAVQYALMRLAQLRAMGYEFDIIEGDPTATWRNASLGVAEAARAAGYENPRDWLAGRPKPARAPADFYTSDVRDPAEVVSARRSSGSVRTSRAKAAQKVVKRPATKSQAKAAAKVVKRPATSQAKKIIAAAKKTPPLGPHRPGPRPKITRAQMQRAKPLRGRR